MKKKVFFFGTPDIAVPSLEKLAHLKDIGIVGVGVFPDALTGRKQVPTPCPVKKSAKSLGLPVYEIAKKVDLLALINSHDFDLGLVIAFGMIFPEAVLQKKKFINVHFSLLPEFRGASPVQSAILAGKKESGITFQEMQAKLDSGPVLFQKKYNIEGKRTSELFSFFAEETAKNLPEFLREYFSGKIIGKTQNESHATFCRKFEKKDGEVFPKKETAKKIYQKFLAFDLFPGIFVATSKGNVKLVDVSLRSSKDTVPLPCAENTTLFISSAQIPGKNVTPAKEILKGNPNIFNP